MIPIDQIDPEPEPAAAGHGRPVGADGVDCRERHHRADHRPAARLEVPDHRRRAALPGGHPGRPARDPDRHPRGRRQRDHRGRARREPPAQGPDGVRGGRSAAIRSPPAATTRTRTWRGAWGSPGHRLPSHFPSTGCPKTSKTYVGWPTFTPSHCFYR